MIDEPIPTDAQIHNWIADLSRSPDHWKRLEARALEMARRARAGTTQADGYKATHRPGASPTSGPTWLVPNETGQLEAVTVTSVEAQALHQAAPDPYGDNASLAFDFLAQAAASIRGYRNAADKAAAMVGGDPISRCCEPGCEDPAAKAGRCGACYIRKYRWEAAHPGELAPPITPDELDVRRKRRRRAQ